MAEERKTEFGTPSGDARALSKSSCGSSLDSVNAADQLLSQLLCLSTDTLAVRYANAGVLSG